MRPDPDDEIQVMNSAPKDRNKDSDALYEFDHGNMATAHHHRTEELQTGDDSTGTNKQQASEATTGNGVSDKETHSPVFQSRRFNVAVDVHVDAADRDSTEGRDSASHEAQERKSEEENELEQEIEEDSSSQSLDEDDEDNEEEIEDIVSDEGDSVYGRSGADEGNQDDIEDISSQSEDSDFVEASSGVEQVPQQQHQADNNVATPPAPAGESSDTNAHADSIHEDADAGDRPVREGAPRALGQMSITESSTQSAAEAEGSRRLTRSTARGRSPDSTRRSQSK
jgi:hypothetical protein